MNIKNPSDKKNFLLNDRNNVSGKEWETNMWNIHQKWIDEIKESAYKVLF